GNIRINGACGEGRSIAELRSVTGFVPQDDVMHRNLTVEENVSFQAQLRLPREEGITSLVARAKQCQAATTDILEQLGLGDSQLRKTAIGDEQVKGVSGGQRKRVSIAMEFVARPSLLFLDEPTSGLDSTTSHSVVDVVTQAAKKQRCTTIAVIHQPRYETLRLFDNVILLAAGGFLVYSGPTGDVERYFSDVLGVRFLPKANPADTLLDAITVDAAAAMLAKGEM
ncbi:Abcg2, partial [Symbiodinium microadriaticum]